MSGRDYIRSLPAEVIQTIAGFCPLRDLVALGLTCSRLRGICDDVVVLQQSFLNNADDPTSDDVPNKATLQRLVAASLSSEDPARAKATWAALALATSSRYGVLVEMRKLRPVSLLRRRETDAVRLPQILRALNTLAVLGYTTIYDSAATAALEETALTAIRQYYMLLHQFETLTPSEHDEWAARLVLEDFMLPVASAVSFGLAVARLENAVLHKDSPLCKPLTSYLNLYASLDNGRFRVGTVFGGFETIQAAGLLVVACIIYTLRCDNKVYERDDLPQPSSLPLLHAPRGDTLSGAVGLLFKKTCGTPGFSAFRHWALLQQLGSPSTWEPWLRHNIDSLVENLTSGEWVGYYTTNDQAGDTVDAPMRGIHFVVDSDDGRLLFLHSETGTDGVGAFTLSVTIKRELSLVRIVKRYHGTHTHIWEQIASLTPLGIAGYWHSARHGGDLLGYVWLFKREWAREGAFPDT